MSHLRDRRREGGFTLIEVLLVLVILVVLGSLAVVAYGPIQAKMKLNAAKSQIGLFETPLEAYQLDIGMYPNSAEGLEALIAPPPSVPPTKWSGPYLKAAMIPADPWGNYYQYSCPGMHNPSSFDIWTVTPDGFEIGNWPEGT